jgi:2-aminoadipate transaminase
MPTFHNPTGITMDLESRKAILQVANRHRLPIIEDDFESELRFAGQELPPLKALDEMGLVLHIGTFSKGLFPGLRLGWIAAPQPIMDTLSRTKMFSDYHTSLLLQAAVLEFCRRGHFEEHIRNLTRIYREKSRFLVEAMTRYLPPEASWTVPEGGYAFWITLPEGMSGETLVAEAARAGVLLTSGSQFFPGDAGDGFLRLSISRVPIDRIEEGVRRLGETLHRLLLTTGLRQDRPPAHQPILHI